MRDIKMRASAPKLPIFTSVHSQANVSLSFLFMDRRLVWRLHIILLQSWGECFTKQGEGLGRFDPPEKMAHTDQFVLEGSPE